MDLNYTLLPHSTYKLLEEQTEIGSYHEFPLSHYVPSHLCILVYSIPFKVPEI